MIEFSPNWETTPAVPSPSEAADPASLPAHSTGDTQRRVIVADDDPVSREIMNGLLTRWGYDVILTNDGREAMEALRAQSGPVLAVLDWMMPGLDGPEICRRVREVNRSVYILLVTARSDKSRVVEGFEAGADDYLVKPFDKDELQARLKVGARILDLQDNLTARVAELEALVAENLALKLKIPL